MKNREYDQINERADIVYRFAVMYADYIATPHDYGTGEKINMIEVHTLTFIDDHPGITITEIASMWNRTKGAVSQTVSKLESKGYIEKRREGGNAKNLHCYTTEAGERLSAAHRTFDVENTRQEWALLLEHVTEAELAAFYKVMEQYNRLILEPDLGIDR